MMHLSSNFYEISKIFSNNSKKLWCIVNVSAAAWPACAHSVFSDNENNSVYPPVLEEGGIIFLYLFCLLFGFIITVRHHILISEGRLVEKAKHDEFPIERFENMEVKGLESVSLRFSLLSKTEKQLIIVPFIYYRHSATSHVMLLLIPFIGFQLAFFSNQLVHAYFLATAALALSLSLFPRKELVESKILGVYQKTMNG